MYKNILVPVVLDHEHDAGAAMKIAHKLLDEGGKILALHVIEEIPQYAAVHLPEDYREKRYSEAMAPLHSLEEGFQQFRRSRSHTVR